MDAFILILPLDCLQLHLLQAQLSHLRSQAASQDAEL